MKIESGTGNGLYAGVDSQNRLRVTSSSYSRQHDVAKNDQNAYQVIGEATPVSGTTTVLFLKNTTANQTFTITNIRLSNVGLTGGTALPNGSNYFAIGDDLVYTSGGAPITPVNTYMGSAKTAVGQFYDSNPTVAGTIKPLDKNFPQANADEEAYTKEGSIIVPPGQSIAVQYIGDHTAGTLYARISFYVSPVDSLDI